MSLIKCDFCKKEFYRKPSQIKLAINHFCSKQCARLASKNGEVVPCFLCKKEVYRQTQYLNKNNKNFCSRGCSIKWHNSEFVGSKHGNWKGGEFSYNKNFRRNSSVESCKLCGTLDKRVLLAHHVDMNRKNNVLSNLAWLCNNCHFLVHHFKEEKHKLLHHLKDKSVKKL